MKNVVKGKAFRVTGLILGIVALVISATSVVMSAIGLHKAHLCKNCKMEAMYK